MGESDGRRAPINWPEIFDLIASEYGYDWEQFTALTYKILNGCLESISKRTHNKTAVLAAMHGIKLAPYRRPKPVSEKTMQRAQEEVSKILAEKQAEIGKRK